MTVTNLRTGEVVGLYSQSWDMTVLCATGKPGAKGVVCDPLDAEFKVSGSDGDVYFKVVE